MRPVRYVGQIVESHKHELFYLYAYLFVYERGRINQTVILCY